MKLNNEEMFLKEYIGNTTGKITAAEINGIRTFRIGSNRRELLRTANGVNISLDGVLAAFKSFSLMIAILQKKRQII